MSTCGLLATPLEEAVLPPNFCAFQLPIALQRPRSVVAVGTSNALVVDGGSVWYLSDLDGDGIPDTKVRVVSAAGINHGLAINGGYLYASSSDIVYRWELNLETAYVGNEEIVITNMNDDGKGNSPGGHGTRTLAFDSDGVLYVSVGSWRNVDTDSFRARIRRFVLNPSTFPIDFTTGEVFADGVRNEVGLTFDRHGVLWGVENFADSLVRDDLGGDIHNENPAEELNRFGEEDAGKSWGYPFCWTEFLLPEPFGMGQGTVWAWPSFLQFGNITDEECRSTTIPPAVAFQAHSAPLGIVFYEWKNTLPAECTGGAFPQEMDGYAFIAYHGSWNRDIPTGYKVVYIPFNENGDPTGDPIDLLAHEPPNAQWSSGLRPVDVDFDDCGRLLVTSDNNGAVLRIEYSLSPPGSGAFQPTESPVSGVKPLMTTRTHFSVVALIAFLFLLRVFK